MIRIIVENILLFLLPAAVYITYHYIAQGEGRSASQAVSDAPLVWLFGFGALVVIAALVLFGQTEGGRPGQSYVPPVFKDGRIEPGQIK